MNNKHHQKSQRNKTPTVFGNNSKRDDKSWY